MTSSLRAPHSYRGCDTHGRGQHAELLSAPGSPTAHGAWGWPGRRSREDTAQWPNPFPTYAEGKEARAPQPPTLALDTLISMPAFSQLVREMRLLAETYAKETKQGFSHGAQSEPLSTVFTASKGEGVSCSVLSGSSPWSAACQAPLSMGSSRQKYWSEQPFTSPGDLPDPGIELVLLNFRWILYCLSNQGSPFRTRGTHYYMLFRVNEFVKTTFQLWELLPCIQHSIFPLQTCFKQHYSCNTTEVSKF